jgi:hypothetical protein
LSFPIDQANIMYTRLIQLIYDIAVHHWVPFPRSLPG